MQNKTSTDLKHKFIMHGNLFKAGFQVSDKTGCWLK